MEGWIKIHRGIKDHWIWKSDHRFKWWLDILLTVNHADSKILIKGKLIECKRGQSVRSLETWAKDWNVTKGTVRDFFKLLESDQMLYTESLQVTTRITVCKYDDYQTELHAEKTQKKRKSNAEETDGIPKQEGIRIIKNENNYINDAELNLLFIDFLNMRKAIKKPATEKAIELLLSKLSKLSDTTAGQKAIIEQSIIKNYQGFFAVSEFNNSNQPQVIPSFKSGPER